MTNLAFAGMVLVIAICFKMIQDMRKERENELIQDEYERRRLQRKIDKLTNMLGETLYRNGMKDYIHIY
jgi:hypothetical protein